jgi:hypothetical protein
MEPGGLGYADKWYQTSDKGPSGEAPPPQTPEAKKEVCQQSDTVRGGSASPNGIIDLVCFIR